MLKQFFKFLAYLKPLKWKFATAIGFGAIAAVTSGAGIPVIAKKVFPMIAGTDPIPEWGNWLLQRITAPENYQTAVLLFACMYIPAIFVVRGIATFINGYLTAQVGMGVLEQIRVGAFARLQILPLSFHEKQKKGDLISRLMNDAQNVQSGITQVANDVIKQPLTLLSAVGFLIYSSMKNAQFSSLLITLLMVSIAIIPILFFSKRVMLKAQRSQERMGDLNAAAQENLASQRDIRSYGMQNQQIGLFLSISNAYRKAQMKSVKYRQCLNPVLMFISSFGVAFLLVKARMSSISYAEFTAICAALFMCYDPVKRLGVSYNRLKQAQASLERLTFILDQEDTMPDPEHPATVDKLRGEVSFNNVCFSYNGGKQVLNHIFVNVPKGQVVGLVGPSGAGKTTFSSLIPRFYDVTSGSISIDGIDLRAMTKHQLRKNIALVSQHVALFRNTIMENIRAGKPNASDEEVIDAARKASAHDFIETMPDGYQTMLGDSGSGLSGGQRQRVAIARAFLKDAPILILDEATASLDAESELRIQDQLDVLVQGKTTFIVAHRFSSIRVAERILVFDDGNIVGDGTHDYLYKACPLYKELFDKQSL